MMISASLFGGFFTGNYLSALFILLVLPYFEQFVKSGMFWVVALSGAGVRTTMMDISIHIWKDCRKYKLPESRMLFIKGIILGIYDVLVLLIFFSILYLLMNQVYIDRQNEWILWAAISLAFFGGWAVTWNRARRTVAPFVMRLE